MSAFLGSIAVNFSWPFLQEHPVFRRKGADLVIEKNLTLVESLCGFDFSITHMDKRVLRVKSNPGQVRPGSPDI